MSYAMTSQTHTVPKIMMKDKVDKFDRQTDRYDITIIFNDIGSRSIKMSKTVNSYIVERKICERHLSVDRLELFSGKISTITTTSYKISGLNVEFLKTKLGKRKKIVSPCTHICTWPLISKINRFHPLVVVNVSAKFDGDSHNGLG